MKILLTFHGVVGQIFILNRALHLLNVDGRMQRLLVDNIPRWQLHAKLERELSELSPAT